ncbi:hypothetical protein NEAUS07_1047 [Nematocida ausubeli]|nr:hypothetical protein NEAUS06_0812 [Nematocida ausubeli]KAI5135187.1 hypothetical protein NEAUS07_1047 [Nematocida ausubeli]
MDRREIDELNKKMSSTIDLVGNIFGYEVKLIGNNRLAIRSLYAFDEDDVFIITVTKSGMQLDMNDYLKKFEKERKLYLDGAKSLGAFLSAVTLSLFEKNTFQ